MKAETLTIYEESMVFLAPLFHLAPASPSAPLPTPRRARRRRTQALKPPRPAPEGHGPCPYQTAEALAVDPGTKGHSACENLLLVGAWPLGTGKPSEGELTLGSTVDSQIEIHLEAGGVPCCRLTNLRPVLLPISLLANDLNLASTTDLVKPSNPK